MYANSLPSVQKKTFKLLVINLDLKKHKKKISNVDLKGSNHIFKEHFFSN